MCRWLLFRSYRIQTKRSAFSLIIPLKSKQERLYVAPKAAWRANSAVGEGRHRLLARLGREPFGCQRVSCYSRIKALQSSGGSRRDFEPQTVFWSATCLVRVRASSASLPLSSKPCVHFKLTVCPRVPGGRRLVVLAMAWMPYLPGSWGSNPKALDIASKSLITHEPGNWWGRDKNESRAVIYQEGSMDGLKRRQPRCLRCQPAASLLCCCAF